MRSLIINKNLLVIMALSVVLFSCKEKPATTADTTKTEMTDTTGDEVTLTQEQYNTAQIKLGKVETRSMGGTIKVNGMLDVPPEKMVSVSVPYGGIVKYTNLLQGQYVKEGQSLAIMEDPSYIQIQQDYAEAIHQLAYLKPEYERQKELKKENITATKTYEKAVSDYEIMKVKAAALKQKLLLIGINPDKVANGNIERDVALRSPISGYVTKVLVNRGKYVQPNDVLFELADTRHTHCELTVFEKDIPLIHIGDKVVFRLASEKKDRIATVVLIGKEIGPDRAVRVHCHLEKEDPSLLPGSFISAQIKVASGNVTALPEKSVIQGPDKYYIYRFMGVKQHKDSKGKDVKDYTFKQVAVQKGMSSDDYTQVYLPDGADDNAEYVTNGAFVLYSHLNMGSEEE